MILLRYFEAVGRVWRAISVVKKRTSVHEDTIREYRIDGRGFMLGEPLTGFHGVLRGVSRWSARRARCSAIVGLIPHLSERALILAPQGCDAEVAGLILLEAGFNSVRCRGIPHLLTEIPAGAGFGLVAKEALRTADLSTLST